MATTQQRPTQPPPTPLELPKSPRPASTTITPTTAAAQQHAQAMANAATSTTPTAQQQQVYSHSSSPLQPHSTHHVHPHSHAMSNPSTAHGRTPSINTAAIANYPSHAASPKLISTGIPMISPQITPLTPSSGSVSNTPRGSWSQATAGPRGHLSNHPSMSINASRNSQPSTPQATDMSPLPLSQQSSGNSPGAAFQHSVLSTIPRSCDVTSPFFTNASTTMAPNLANVIKALATGNISFLRRPTNEGSARAPSISIKQANGAPNGGHSLSTYASDSDNSAKTSKSASHTRSDSFDHAGVNPALTQSLPSHRRSVSSDANRQQPATPPPQRSNQQLQAMSPLAMARRSSSSISADHASAPSSSHPSPHVGLSPASQTRRHLAYRRLLRNLLSYLPAPPEHAAGGFVGLAIGNAAGSILYEEKTPWQSTASREMERLSLSESDRSRSVERTRSVDRSSSSGVVSPRPPALNRPRTPISTSSYSPTISPQPQPQPHHQPASSLSGIQQSVSQLSIATTQSSNSHMSASPSPPPPDNMHRNVSGVTPVCEGDVLVSMFLLIDQAETDCKQITFVATHKGLDTAAIFKSLYKVDLSQRQGSTASNSSRQHSMPSRQSSNASSTTASQTPADAVANARVTLINSTAIDGASKQSTDGQ